MLHGDLNAVSTKVQKTVVAPCQPHTKPNVNWYVKLIYYVYLDICKSVFMYFIQFLLEDNFLLYDEYEWEWFMVNKNEICFFVV